MKKLVLVAVAAVCTILFVASCEKDSLDENQTIAIDKDKVQPPGGQSIDKDKAESPGGNGNG